MRPTTLSSSNLAGALGRVGAEMERRAARRHGRGCALAGRYPDLSPAPGELRAPPAGYAELVVRPDPAVGDGRLANNPRAQELPRPLSTLTWDNAIEIGPGVATAHGLDGWRCRPPDFRWAHHRGADPDSARTGGRHGADPSRAGRRCGSVASGVGFDATPLADARFVALEATGDRRALAAA